MLHTSKSLRAQAIVDQAEKYYLEYVNDFLTVDAFASYHGLTRSFAARLINAGRQVNSLRQKETIENAFDL